MMKILERQVTQHKVDNGTNTQGSGENKGRYPQASKSGTLDHEAQDPEH